MKAIIIDDVEKVALSLKQMVETYCKEVEIVAVANSADQGKEYIEKYKPDFIFLDIQMPGKGGFDLLQSFERIDFEVIFVTAFNEYAIKAIKFGAIDYILKPVDLGELRDAIQRVQEKDKAKKEEIKNLLENLKNPGDDSNTLIINSEKGSTLVKIRDIVRIQSDGNYSTLHLLDGSKHVSSKNLKNFELFLEKNGFVRVHHSHLININQLAKLNKESGLEVIMSTGDVVPVSVRKKQDLMEHFNKF